MEDEIANLLQEMIEHRDVYSLLVNKTGDGGDCAHNFPMHYVNLSCLGSLDEYTAPPVLSFRRDVAMISCLNTNLGISTGQYVRHCDTTAWYSKLKYMSRDQTKSILSGLAYYGLISEVRSLYLELKSRKFMHWNTEESDPPYQKKIADICSPTQFSLFIRTLPELSYLSFLLPILDLDLLYGSIWGKKRWDAACKQYIELLATEKAGKLNIVTKLAVKLFKRDAQSTANNIESAFTVGGLQIPPLGKLLKMGYLAWSKN